MGKKKQNRNNTTPQTSLGFEGSWSLGFEAFSIRPPKNNKVCASEEFAVADDETFATKVGATLWVADLSWRAKLGNLERQGV